MSFFNEYLFWAVNKQKFRSFSFYNRLYSYAYNYFFIKLKPNVYFSIKSKPAFKFDFINAFFNGLYLETKQFFFVYSELYYPLIFLAIWYKYFRHLLVSIFLSLFFLSNLLIYFHVNALRQVAIWIIVGLLFFWLISGFNFFLKRYRFGKFTSAILRFWKRTNAIFWLVEGFLFSLFFYYYLNSSQEPAYFYDTSSLNQDYLFSLSNSYLSSLLLVLLIWYSYYVLLKLPQNTFKQTFFHLSCITFVFSYVFLLESYQFYYALTLFFDLTWVFDLENNLWVIDFDSTRLRVKQQYLLLALIAKYWHFLFIFIGWLFFIFKSFEQKRVYYNLLGWNNQNLIILFFLNILFMAQWLKWLFRRYYDIVYYWFFTDTNQFSFNYFVNEVELLLFTDNSFVFLTDAAVEINTFSNLFSLFNLV